jgi:hypothetical protein
MIREGLTSVIVEGDSALVINTTKRLQCGTNIGKVIRHWRLAQTLQRILKHLQTIVTIEFRWIRRSTNALVDILANEGAIQGDNMLDEAWIGMPRGQLRSDCEHLVNLDHSGSFRNDSHIGAYTGQSDPAWDPGEV